MPDAPQAPLPRLIDELKKLPGIGSRSAERIAFHLLKVGKSDALRLADTIRDIKEKIRPCRRCFHLAEGELCDICSNGRRDAGSIVVVEQPKDLLALETLGLVDGVYHVLMGRLSPLDGVEPADLTIAALLERCRDESVREVILATNPTLEGDATALFIVARLEELNRERATPLRVTRLARGLAPGGQIEFANKSMLEEAFKGRKAMD